MLAGAAIRDDDPLQSWVGVELQGEQPSLRDFVRNLSHDLLVEQLAYPRAKPSQTSNGAKRGPLRSCAMLLLNQSSSLDSLMAPSPGGTF